MVRTSGSHPFRRKPSALTEVRDLQSEPKSVVFFAEDASDWLHIGPLADHLEPLGCSVLRLTADPNDSIITTKSGIHIGGTLAATQLFLRLPPCVVVMTMTDLGTYHLKRSVHDVHYVYVFHSLLSTHRAYRANAFDSYDSILCATPYHVAELEKAAAIRDIRPQALHHTGYCRLDHLISKSSTLPTNSSGIPRVLVAPTWGPSSLIEFGIDRIIRNLLDSSIQVALRFHPMSFRHHKDLHHQYYALFGDHPLFTLDNSFASSATLLESDLVLSDWSGAAHEFALGLLRPAIFVDTPQKAHNDIYSQLDIECYEDVVREDLGALVGVQQAGSLPDVVTSLIDERVEWRQRLELLRDQVLFNPGDAVHVAAKQILNLIT